MAFTQISGNGLKNNSITNAHLHSGANIAASKLADSGVTAGSYGSASLIPAITVNAQGLVTSLSTNSFTTTDNNFTDALLSKLNGIEASATADQTNAEIKTAYEANSDTNAFTDALLTKLNGIAANANNYSFPYTVSVSASNSTIVQRHSSGYIFANYFNTTPNDIATGSITKICAESANDGYIRHATAAAVRSFLNVADGANNYSFPYSVSQSATGSSLVQRDSNGNISAGYLNIDPNDVTSGVTKLVCETSNDGWTRHATAGAVRAFINVADGATNNGSGSLSSYLPLSGGTVTGAVTVNGGDLRVDGGRNLRIGDGAANERILIQKADNNTSDHIIFYNGTTRIGEIGCEDNSWLRINQETAKNIYTPRLIRADAGFQVDGNYIANETGSLRVSANQDIGFANGTWSGNNTKIQLHSNTLYIVGGSNGIILRESGTNRWVMDGSGHFYPGGSNNYDLGNSSNFVRYSYINRVYVGNSSRYLGPVNGDYGSIQINGGGAGNYEGFSIDGRAVFLHDGGGNTGIYNDVNNEWMLYCGHNTTSILYFNGAQRVRTEDYGCRIAGTIRPFSTNGGDCGASDARWGTVYASNGSINTSDRNEKNTIIDSDLGLNFINKLKAVSYKWNDEEIGEKTHYGLVAQDIEETIKEIGKDVDNIGMIDKPEKGAMGLNYNELIAPLVKAIQELSAKVAALEAA